MGEQVTYSTSEAVERSTEGRALFYFPKRAFECVRNIAVTERFERERLFANLARFNTLYMIAKAGSGHLGSSFSSMDIAVWLHLNWLQDGDRYFSSKGHDSPGLYAIQAGLGIIPFEMIHLLRRLGGLPGHPDVSTPGAFANTGALGMGISKAKGFVFSDRHSGEKERRTYVMTGDGELQEGQIWESLSSAINSKMGEITVIVDHNKVQSDSLVSSVSDLGCLTKKFEAFGWVVRRCSGHDFQEFSAILKEFAEISNVPKVLIADTVKGSGVTFMEHTSMSPDELYYKYHSGAPTEREYLDAVEELLGRIERDANALGIKLPQAISTPVDPVFSPNKPQRLIPAYTEALLSQASIRKDLVALDADLILDTGLISFKEKFPERFVECGIAEQDMVSQASAMALSGLLPIVHSFACFLTQRANEQIYNAATERTKIIYVGSLAGVLPGGPGHSHQAVRDIAVLSGIPNFIMIEPASPRQVTEALEWCVNQTRDSTYLRLTSIPCEYRVELDTPGNLVLGQGQVIRSGADITVIGYGPLTLGQILEAADRLEQVGISVQVINLPWLNYIDQNWLHSAVANTSAVLTVDNHYLHGGQGQLIASSLIGVRDIVRFKSIGLNEIPAFGRNQEVLSAVGLDSENIFREVKTLMSLN